MGRKIHEITEVKKMKKQNIIIYTIAIAIIITISLNHQNPEPKDTSETTTHNQQITDQQILENLQNHPELKPYETYSTKITHLTENNIKQLTETQPAIYANLTGKNLCKIEYTSASDGYLVIYNTEKDKILKQFRILNMQIN